MSRAENIKAFIGKLESLTSGDRAVLKRNAGNPLAETRGGAIGIFYRILPFGIHPNEEELWFIVATLRFLNRYKIEAFEDEPIRDFGWTMSEIKRANKSDSFDLRVRGLLDCRWNVGDGALAHRLRQMVKLADGKSVPIDWESLLKDLLNWEHPERWVQKKWARSYFGSFKEDSDPKISGENDNSKEE
jgi:CRISPR system Cascade subunit CasB